MTDNVVVYWILGHLWIFIMGLWAILIIAIVWWDGRGRYKAMVREAEKARRG